MATYVLVFEAYGYDNEPNNVLACSKNKRKLRKWCEAYAKGQGHELGRWYMGAVITNVFGDLCYRMYETQDLDEVS